MPGFYKNTVAVFLALAVLTSLIAYACLQRTFLSDPLLPSHKSVIPWKAETDSDVRIGGSSSASINDTTHSLDFNITVKPDVEYPYASLMLIFGDPENAGQVADLSKYSTLSFDVKCAPQNVLTLTVFSIDEKVTKPAEIATYRMASTYFSCRENWTHVEIDLQHLEVAEWWLKTF
ncbi:MAG TPA: AraC family transcriptional regulator, partial [Gammaproteobacteria bacterium]